MAHVRAENKQRKQDSKLGMQLVLDVEAGFDKLNAAKKASRDELCDLLDKASRACELLHCHPSADIYPCALKSKAKFHSMMGQRHLAVAARRQADDHFTLAERKGLVKQHDHAFWIEVVQT